MFKKLTSMVLAGVMALSVMASVTAADVNQSGGSGDSKVTLDINSRNLKVTVPSVLPIWVDSDNNVTVATNAKIQNRSDGPVDVTDVSVEADNNWSLVDFNTDFTKVPVDTKQYGMTMYNDDVIDGVNLSLFDRINGSDEIAVQYNGNVAIQSSNINKLDIGHVVFTVAWADGERLGVNDITYNVENAAVQAYLATPDYNSNDYSYTNFTGTATSTTDKPATGTLSVPNGAVKITVTSEDDGKNFTDSLSGSTYEVGNLIPGVVYDYTMYDSSNSAVKSGKIYPTGTRRMIDGQNNTFNIRDLGGIQADGGKLKYGMIYRGSELEPLAGYYVSLPTERAEYFRDFLGIRAELDLRSNAELADYTEQALLDADYQHNPITGYQGAFAFSAAKRGPGTTVIDKTVIGYIADKLSEGKPVYIHCLEGADRTATVVALVEALCGVSQSDIDKDYEMTSFAKNRQRLRTLESYKNFMASLNKMRGNTLQEKAVSWAQKMGISIETINKLRNALIDGNPATVNDLSTEYVDMFDSSDATLNARINSSNNAVNFQTGQLVTGYIPVTPDSKIKIVTDKSLKTNGYTGQASIYASDKSSKGTSYNSETSWTLSDDKLQQEGAIYQVWDLTRREWFVASDVNEKPTYYIRICIPYNDINNIHVYVKDV